MSKKIFRINVVVVLLVFIVYSVGSIYINSYPIDLEMYLFIDISAEDWLYFSLILLGNLMLSRLLSFIPIKSFNRKDKWGGWFLIFNLVFIFWMLSIAVSSYFENKRIFKIREAKILEKAQKDIKKDYVVWYFIEGLPWILEEEEIIRKKDSIYQKYGIKIEHTGCISLNNQDILERKYKEIVKKYLDKRNGEGWEERMNKEIEKIKK